MAEGAISSEHEDSRDNDNEEGDDDTDDDPCHRSTQKSTTWGKLGAMDLFERR